MQLKKIFSFFIFFFTTGFVFSEIPEQIKGIWTGKDRIIFFGGNDEISIILKEYYGWYYDRAVEPDDFSNIQERKRNAATQKLAHDYKVSFEKIENTTNAWEMTIFIDEKTKSVIPVALIDDKIYLDFLVKADSENQEETETLEKNLSENLMANEKTEKNPLTGYWQGLNSENSIRISQRNSKENIISWYITENSAYQLRFWSTKMPHEDSKAVFADNNTLYTINKQIFSAGTNYTCVSGKGTNIRNVEKYADFPLEYKLDENEKIIALGMPFLSKVEGKNSAENLMEIVAQANSRRKKDPPQLFPEKELDWHWELINQLEKGNPIIEKVRERQRNFGPRPGDFQK
ncbi:MAG: hypothetical protein UIB61_02720 [Treponema sp.]|nr:hypothetical protein [Treponema sp.]